VTTFEVTGHVLLQVSTDGGDLAVEAADVRQVEVELVPLRDNDVTREVIAAARVEMAPRSGGHEVVVELKRRSAFGFGRGPQVGIRVRCPKGSDLAARTSSADVRAIGSLGAVDVKTASGDVLLENAGSLRAETASGDVRVRDVEGGAEIRTTSGDASLRRCGGHLRAKLVSGDLTVDDATAGLDVTTVSGDLHVRAAGGGGMQVQSVSGDVELGVAAGQRLYVDASSVSGTMSTDLGLDDAPPAGPDAPVRDLRVRTISGDVRIVRAAATAA
jgi:DUF4097 and DUF4098 domain-containing protein YvlB